MKQDKLSFAVLLLCTVGLIAVLIISAIAKQAVYHACKSGDKSACDIIKVNK